MQPPTSDPRSSYGSVRERAFQAMPHRLDTSHSMSQNTQKRKRARHDFSGSENAAKVAASQKANEGSDSELDKKRNKLGYQRSTIACVHCRRRKIRCVLAPDDKLGRCAHCIRMKKDCSFVSMDQTVPRAKKRPESIRKAMSEPSSMADMTGSEMGQEESRPSGLGRSMTQRAILPSRYVSLERQQRSTSYTSIPEQSADFDPSHPSPNFAFHQRTSTSQLDDYSTSFPDELSTYRSMHRMAEAPIWNSAEAPTLDQSQDQQTFPNFLQGASSTAFDPLSSTMMHNTTFDSSSGSLSNDASDQALQPQNVPMPAFGHSRNRSQTISLHPVHPASPFKHYDTPGHQSEAATGPLQDHALDPTFTTATTYLSPPLTSASGPATSHPSVSPMPHYQSYISPPPTSQPSQTTFAQPAMSVLPSQSADDALQMYYAQHGMDTASQSQAQQNFSGIAQDDVYQQLRSNNMNLTEPPQLSNPAYTPMSSSGEQGGYPATSGPEGYGYHY